jgi:branched-chain amino acid transport system ATP-binding protein
MLELAEIHTYYGQSHVLQGVSLHVKRGEIVGLLGRNGMGKTTTLKSIMGLVPVRSGEIRLDSLSIERRAAHRIPELGLHYIPQGQRVFAEFSVLENLQIGSRKKIDGAILERVTRSFPVLRERLEQSAGTLSGGEQQMLAIARAMLDQPQYLLMDEPTEGLMPSMVNALEEQIKELRSQKMGILLAEQNADTALRVCDRFYILEKGCVSLDGDAHQTSLADLRKHLGVGI